MLRFVSQVNNFFSFCESFSRRPSVVFLKARGAFMLRFAFEVNNFFPFRETFCFTVEPVVFFNREERLCSPSLQESTVFFVSAKFHFACVSVNRSPSSRGAFMLHPAPQVNHFFHFRQINFRKQRLSMLRKLKILKHHRRVKPEWQFLAIFCRTGRRFRKF